MTPVECCTNNSIVCYHIFLPLANLSISLYSYWMWTLWHHVYIIQDTPMMDTICRHCGTILRHKLWHTYTLSIVTFRLHKRQPQLRLVLHLMTWWKWLFRLLTLNIIRCLLLMVLLLNLGTWGIVSLTLGSLLNFDKNTTETLFGYMDLNWV